jgi:Tol biopolymer transport system component
MAAVPASGIGAAPARRPFLGGWTGIVAGLVLGAAATWLGLTVMAPGSEAPPVRKFRLTTNSRQPSLPKISRDGRKIAYLENDRIWIRDLTELEAREVAGTEGVSLFDWSPDGRWLAISRDGKLWKIPATGGQANLLCDLPETLYPGNAAEIAWAEDGRVAYNLGSAGVMTVPEGGGTAVSLVDPGEGELDFHHVGALPGGRGFLFVVHRPEGMDLIAAVTDQGRVDILEIPGQAIFGPKYSPSGHLVFLRSPDNEGLWAVPFSLQELATTGQPFPLMPADGGLSVSRDGTLVHVRPAPKRETRLVRVNRQGLVTSTVGEPQLGQAQPALSPDGSQVAVTAVEGDNTDVWILDIESGIRRRLTFAEAAESAPVWLPSGEEVAFSRPGSKVGDAEIIAAAADGSGRSRAFARGSSGRFSADGRFMVYVARDEQLDQDIWYRSLAEDGKPVQLLETDGNFEAGFSPDGRYVVFASTDTGRSEVYITRFPSAEGRWQVSSDGGILPRWSHGGDRIFFVAGNELMEIPVTTGASPSLGRPQALFTWEFAARGYDVTADGREFIMVEETDPGALGAQIVVVENWASEFHRAG